MNNILVRLVSRLLIICMIGLPFQVQAGLIGTDSVVSAAQASAARDTVAAFMNRSDVASQLQTLGLSGSDAKDRVAALSDAEVAKMAGQIQSLPAGGSSAGVILAVVLIGFLIWWLVKR